MRSRLVPGRLRLVLAALSTVSVMAAGCAVGPDYARPPVEEPSLFKSGGAGEPGPTVPTDWWRLYSDPELDRLIASVHPSNPTRRQAGAPLRPAPPPPPQARPF